MPELTVAPWEGLPPAVAELLRPQLSGLADEIVEALVEGVPAYARPLRGGFGRGIRVGVEEALRRFLALAGGGGDGTPERRDVYRALGRGELRAGRSLDALQAAYRLGARVAWRRLAAEGAAAGLDPETLHLLAESIFAYIDELAAESVEGYAQEQAEQAGEHERRRRRLLAELTATPVVAAEVEAAAQDAGWPLPERAAGIAARGTSPGRLVARLGDDVLAVGEGGGITIAVWPDPGGPGRAVLARRALDGSATVGWEAPLAAVGRSLATARACLTLGEAGALGDGPWFVDDHLRALALRDDEGVLERLAARRLAPLEDLTPKAHARLEATLLAWLRAQGHLRTAAVTLGVHPQTVRYRTAQLRELFGSQLDDPDARFELELALRRRSH